MEPQNEHSVGPTIGLIIIMVLIVLGGFYFWGERSDAMKEMDDGRDVAAEVSAIEDQSDSDETSSIEADLENTHTETLDAELNAS